MFHADAYHAGFTDTAVNIQQIFGSSCADIEQNETVLLVIVIH